MFIRFLKIHITIFLIGVSQYFAALGAEDIEGKWNKPGIPHRGWTHLAVEDLEGITGVCEMCDKKRIRYLHTVSHDEYEDLAVGRDCAEKMCQDKVNPKKKEAQTKNAARQREVEARRVAIQREEAARRAAERINRIQRDWLDVSKWRTTAKGGYSKSIGNEWLNIFKYGQNWKFVFQNQFSEPYASLPEVLQATYILYGNHG